MDDEKNGRCISGEGKPSISQAELDALFEKNNLSQSSSMASQPRLVIPVRIYTEPLNSEDIVPGDEKDIDQSELDALLSGQDGKEVFADTPAQAKAAKTQAEQSQPAKGNSTERVLTQDEIDAMIAALGK
jgi:hypothetical protein